MCLWSCRCLCMWYVRGFIKGSGALITPPPENKRIVRTWDPMMTVETDGHHAGLLLSDVVKYVLLYYIEYCIT